MGRLLFLTMFLFISSIGYAQLRNLPLNKQSCRTAEKSLNSLTNCVHTAFQPYPILLQEKKPTGSKDRWELEFTDTIISEKRSWFYRKLREENLIYVDSGKQYLTVDPILNLEFGVDHYSLKSYDNYDTPFRNGRGFRVEGDLGAKVSFSTSFFENQAFFLSYINRFVEQYGVVPGQGRTKSYITKINNLVGYDYAFATGYVSFQPISALNIQMGHGKHFIGDGYRSLILSDNSFNYPFLRISTTLGKFHYNNLYAVYKNLNVELPTSPVTERRFQQKASTIHHLSYAVNNRLQLGVFEAALWRSLDKDERWNAADYFGFFNPIMMVRPIQYGMDGDINLLTGLNCNFKLNNKILAYTQAVLDDHKTNRFGYQIGIKFHDVLHIQNLFAQFEYNHAEPYTYGHRDSTRSYTHYNQALAHPLGAGFDEALSCIYYRYKDFFIESRTQLATYQDDSLMTYHNGKDLFKSYDNGYSGARNLGQTTLLNQSIRLGYIVNPVTNLQVFTGYTHRLEKSSSWQSENNYFYIGVTSVLSNTYYDF